MDFKHLINNVTNVFTNGEPLSITSIFHEKGEFGEYASDYVLNNLAITKKTYIRTIKNVYIENNGQTTELDLIAVTEHGIYVLESKNYSGWIFGDLEGKNWTQCLPNGEKNKFYSPYKQNEGHRKKMIKLLGVDPAKVYSLIVFSDRCTLKKVPESTDSIKFLKREDLLWVMKRDLDKRVKVFSKEEVDAIYDKLQPLNQKTAEEKQKHIEQVKNIQQGNICPRCKNKLVLRKGQYGEFYGCSGYPQCRYTEKIDKK